MRQGVLRSGPVASLGIALLAAGCSLLSRPEAPTTRYFVLTGERAPRSITDRREVAIGIGPFAFPSYLQRPQMVRRTEPNQLTFSQFNRWAEPVASGFPRVLAEDVSRAVGTDQIVLFPWYRIPLDYQIKGEVLRFEVSSEGEAVLECIWTVYDLVENRYRVTRHSSLRRPVSLDDPDEIAAALSGLVGDLASAIVREEVLRPHPPRRSPAEPAEPAKPAEPS